MLNKKTLVGFTVDTFHGFSPADILRQFKFLGIRFIEFTINLLDDFENVKPYIGGIRTAFHLPIVHVEGWDFSCANTQEKTDKTIKQIRDFHRALNVQHIVAHPPECRDKKNDPAGMDLWLENISKLPVPIYIENVHHVPMDTFFEVYQTAKTMLGSKIAGICFDVAHAYLDGMDPIEQFRSLKQEINCIHLSDCSHHIDKHLPFGCGGVLPIQKFLFELSDFHGSITLEIKPRSLYDIPALINSYLETLKMVRKDLYYYSAIRLGLMKPILRLRINKLVKKDIKTKRG
ncbi:sugar phosphate isomerase/epimerase [candidate division KSB1 bacterium]|nr:sugar phosphate isomerase/epimerase [candidate division KSB1 bacterium]